MSQLTPRNIDILRIIVEEYLDTGEVLGSKALLKKYALGVSPATVRNDMANLEKLELIFQPYNSAGRLPTAKGLRAFVNYLMQQYPDHFLGTKNTHKNESLSELADYIHTLVYELAKNT
jgi:heat-inducible transcriptional repressor